MSVSVVFWRIWAGLVESSETPIEDTGGGLVQQLLNSLVSAQ
jgi:hypothetical protein